MRGCIKGYCKVYKCNINQRFIHSYKPAKHLLLTKKSSYQLFQRLQKKLYTAPPQEVTIPGNEYIEQRNCFSLTMSIHKFAEYPTEQRGNSTMLATSGWLGMQLWYPQACSLISWLTKLFHSATPFSYTAYFFQYNV